MSDRLTELNMLTNHHDHHYRQMEIAHVEGRKTDAEHHRLEMGRGQERALEIEHELQDEYRDRANRGLMARYAAHDAGPAWNEYVCRACEDTYNHFTHQPVYVDGVIWYCPACANPVEFSKGQRVRFVNAPSLTGTVTARRHCHVENEWKYTVVGDAEKAVLGDDYGREDLEAVTT